jgi:hypothetical protein
MAGDGDAVGEGGSERAGHHVSEPDGDGLVQAELPPGEGWDEDDDPEEDARSEVPEAR